MERIDPAALRSHVDHLAITIGARLAGSDEEAEAARYVAGRLEASGARVSEEPFAIGARRVRSQSLSMRRDGTWCDVPCSVIAGSRGTGGNEVEAPVVVLEPPALRRASYDDITGKAVLLLTTHIEEPEHYRRLMEASPSALIMVDMRYPTDDLRADGLFPAYVHRYGAVPTVLIPYARAWDLLAGPPEDLAARLRIDGGTEPGVSTNVCGELPGDDGEQAPLLFVTAHHDTQADSPGADDNASGVAALLELARVLSPVPRRRTIRFISFGTEEQLSVGSAAYVRAHRGELQARGGYVANFDAFGSRMGWFDVYPCLHPKAHAWLKRFLDARGQYAEYAAGVSPYQDGFPLHAAGIPGHWVYRRNCTMGRFFHHQRDDDSGKLGFDVMERMVTAHAEMLCELAQAREWPFPLEVPEDLRADIDRYWTDCFGGWEGFCAPASAKR